MRRSYLAAALAAAAVTLASAGCNAQSRASGGDDAAFGERVHAYLLAHPEVIGEAIAKLQSNEAAEKAAQSGAAILQHRQALEHDPRDVVVGNPAGAVTLVEFFDYRCPYCKAAEPALQKLLQSHKNVRLVLKEFPILDVEDQTHISEDAARDALAAVPQGKYMPVHEALFAQPHLDEDAIRGVLAGAGVNLAADAALAHSQAISAHLADNHQLARAIGVEGTPAFVIDGKMIGGADVDALEAAIAEASRAR